ncbi:BTB/POZ domain-containing protein 1 [Exaiptasia diaphana]|nr:BTB/POZ domain-containing protein 1 [Exaiptasia diaphana]
MTRFSKVMVAWDYSGTPNANLVGVRLFGSEGSNYEVGLKINDNYECLAELSSSFMSEQILDGLYHGFTVTLDKPVRLVSGQVYRLEARISGPKSYLGGDCAEIVQAGDIVVTFSTASLPNNSTSVNADGDGNKVTVPSNKYVLATTSPVFAVMFYGHLAENKPTIDLPDCTKEGLQEILRYSHCEEANITGRKVMELLYLAKKYMMPFLEKKCKEYLETEVGPEDVFIVLPQVRKMGDEDLQEHLWEIVDKQTHRAISSESFLDASKELLCQVLKRDTLSASEVHIFEAVDKWATKQIDERDLVCEGEAKRAILGEDLIRLIRFPLMSQKEFGETVLPLQVLNLYEVTEMFQFFSAISPNSNIFNNRRRRFSSKSIVISRFSNFNIRRLWVYTGTPNAINLTVNKDVNLVGVRLFGSAGCNYDVTLKICKYNRSECQDLILSCPPRRCRS